MSAMMGLIWSKTWLRVRRTPDWWKSRRRGAVPKGFLDWRRSFLAALLLRCTGAFLSPDIFGRLVTECLRWSGMMKGPAK